MAGDFTPAGNLQRTVLDWSRGFFANPESHLQVPQGFASALTNWEVDRAGMIMPRPGLTPGSGVAALANPNTVGIGYINGYYVIVHQGGVSKNVYYSAAAAGSPPGAWSVGESGVGGAGTPVLMATGNNYLLWGSPGDSAIRYYKPTATVGAVAGTLPLYPNAIEFFSDRFFIGSVQGPGGTVRYGRLYYSEAGGNIAAEDWPGNFIDVVADDGQHIYGLAANEDGLYIGKPTGVWLLTGSGPSTFDLVKLNGPGVQIGAGRPMVATPYGIVVAGQKHVALYRGGEAENISKQLEWGTLFGSGGANVHMAYSADKLFILSGGASSGYVYDFMTECWAKFALNAGTSALSNAAIFALPGNAGPVVMGLSSSTSANPMVALTDLPWVNPGAVLDSVGSGYFATAQYAYTTAPFMPGGGTRRFTLRHIDVLSFAQVSAAVSSTLNYTVKGMDGSTLTSGSKAIAGAHNKVTRFRLNPGVTDYAMSIEFTHTDGNGHFSPIEIALLWEWEGAEEGNA